MKLTGKAKEKFDKWLSKIEETPIKIYAQYENELEVYVSEHFYILPLSMQYGVYEDFFSSIGLYGYKDKARKELIKELNEKANEIYSKDE